MSSYIEWTKNPTPTSLGESLGAFCVTLVFSTHIVEALLARPVTNLLHKPSRGIMVSLHKDGTETSFYL